MIAVFTETNGLLHGLCISIKNVLFGRWCCGMPFDGETDLLLWALAN